MHSDKVNKTDFKIELNPKIGFVPWRIIKNKALFSSESFGMNLNARVFEIIKRLAFFIQLIGNVLKYNTSILIKSILGIHISQAIYIPQETDCFIERLTNLLWFINLSV